MTRHGTTWAFTPFQRRLAIAGIALGIWAASAAFCWLLLLEASAR